MGRNGSGKSSLLWALQGSGPRRGGRGDASHGRDPAGARRRPSAGAWSGWCPQNAADLLYLETVADECAADRAAAAAPADAIAGPAGARASPATRHPRDLSEGQRLALALALVLAAAPRVLLLDEPTRGLDYPAKARARRDRCASLAADGHAVLVATHDVEFVAQVADDVVVLAEGEVVSSGPVRRVVAESPAFAPQVTKVLGPPWLRVDEVAARAGPRR